MTIVFPSSPVIDQTYPDPPITGLPVWTFDGEKWVRGGAREQLSDAPTDGNLWGRRDGQWSQINIPETPEDTSVVPIGGQLRWVNQNLIGYYPFNGGWMRIDGKDYPLPATGIIAGRTNIWIDGVPGQTLANSTLYYVYLFVVDNELVIDYSVTGHQTSTSPGNTGVEIKQGDNSRTLIGMVYLISSQFYEHPNWRLVRSWLNRVPTTFSRAGDVWCVAPWWHTNDTQCWILAFAGETCVATVTCQLTTNVAVAHGVVAITINDVIGSNQGATLIFAESRSLAVTTTVPMSEGLNRYGSSTFGVAAVIISGTAILAGVY